MENQTTYRCLNCGNEITTENYACHGNMMCSMPVCSMIRNQTVKRWLHDRFLKFGEIGISQTEFKKRFL